MTFYSERMAAIQNDNAECLRKIKEIDIEISAVQSQLGVFNNMRPEPVSEITVTVVIDEKAAKGASSDITLTYFVFNANWRPSYDIRAKNTTEDIALHYKANVSQNTGENWEEVKLTLSTGNPSASGECPDLKPWYLSFYQEPKISQYQAFNAPIAAKSMMREECCEEVMCECDEQIAAPPVSAVTVTESTTSVEYNIRAPYTIASGDGGQDVEIMTHSLQAKYRYYSIRKLEREVFLLAAVSGWEHLNLIAGNASIFFENRYVGKTRIDPRRAGDTIDLSLGVDKSIVVTRVRGKDFTAKTFAGGSTKQTRQWELTARNLKTSPVDIELLDQVPVSTDKQITVEATDISGAEMNKDTGILTWKFSLKPAESRSMVVKYVVTSPKNTTVLLD